VLEFDFGDAIENTLGVKRQSSDQLRKFVNTLRSSKVISLCSNLTSILPFYNKNSTSKFEFLANTTLSGGAYPCSALDCRLEKVNSLAHFSALYADRVLISDPFESLVFHYKTSSINRLREEFLAALEIVFYIADLVQCEFVGFAESKHYHFCRHCYSKYVAKETHFENRLREAEAFLDDLLQKEVSLEINFNRNHIDITASSNSSIYDRHDRIFELKNTYSESPIGNENRDDLIDQYSNEISNLYRKSEIENIMDDTIRQNYYSTLYGTSTLTTNTIDLLMLEFLNKNESRNINKNSVISDDFSHYVPLIRNASIKSLIKLRNNESESFSVYRDAMSKAIDEAQSSDSSNLKEIFRDIVQPEINNMNLAVRNTKTLLRDGVARDIIFGTGFVTLGVFSGLLPANIGQIIAALGGFHYAQGVFGKISDLLKQPPSIKDNKFYFLWKAQKIEGNWRNL